jgi:hypothetical protein
MTPFFVVGIICAVVSTVSLFFANEGIRGGGRIVGGLAWIFIGLNFELLGDLESLPRNCVVGGFVLVICGVVTALFGVRKLRRRNLKPQ